MRDEIQAGLKNAIERGDTLDQAVQSFISAGYNPVEVKEAANSLNSNISPIVSNINSSKSQVDLQNKGNMFTNIAQSSTRNSITQNTPMSPITPTAPQFPITQAEQPKPQISQIQPITQMPQMQPMQSNYQQLSSQPQKTTGFHSKKVVIVLGIILLVLGLILGGLIVFSKTLLSIISGNG